MPGARQGREDQALGLIRVTAVRRERLDEMLNNTGWGAVECRAEGFPEMTPADFVAFFCKSHKGCTPASEVTRIQFEYVN
jgi:hypothetical protein